ncbi:hypothetical protein ACMGD3_04200 [Lysinibacillus sphaericus]|uniref:hypothetical protein n=1 Tax=Lysinibacillus sphaericus TaxID=1421 RepID=UPI003F798737
MEQRLDSLEPPEPTTILDLPFPFEKGTEVRLPTDVIPISEVSKEGTKIPFKVIKSEPNYIRPIYEEQWHSTYWGGRWSYIPSRILNGVELDYSLISYQPPDYWLKQKQRNEREKSKKE